jgi:hypothetical protein
VVRDLAQESQAAKRKNGLASGPEGNTAGPTPVIVVLDANAGPEKPTPARKGGRPVILVESERMKELRGDHTQAVFARLCRVSVDAIQRAECHGRSSEGTIRKIVRKLRSKGQNVSVKDLIKNTPQ